MEVEKKSVNGLGIASLAFGIVGILTICGCGIGFVFGIIGIILGIFTGCILFDVINAFFHKPFFKLGLWMGKLVKHFLNL